MGRKKIIQKIPKAVIIKCPHCSANFRVKNNSEGVFSVECRKCKQKILTPITQCCIICAFSDKRCSNSLLIEAKAKNLEIR